MVKLGLYIAALMTGLVSASCATHSADAPIVSVEAGCQAGFYVTLSGSGPDSSRSPSPGTYEPGSIAENYIDIEGGDFSILFFDAAGVCLGGMTDVDVTPDPSSATMKRYLVNGLVPEALVKATSGFKMVMLANWGADRYPEAVAGATELGDLALNSAYDFALRPDTVLTAPIPMFGVTDLLEGLEFHSGQSTWLGNLFMLRAYAKVRVRAAEGSLPLESVELTAVNTRGYMAPLGVSSESDYVHGAYAPDYWPHPSVPSDSRRVPLKAEAYEDGVWCVYVPEYANLANPSERSRIKVRFEGVAEADYVDFKYYEQPPSWAGASEGDAFDILRNTIYDYTLRKTDVMTELEVEVDVMPYAEVVLTPDFGVERDDATGWIIVNKYADRYYFDDLVGQYYDKDKKPMARRVERNESGLYVVSESNSERLRYTYDAATGSYYTDYDGTIPLTSLSQLRFDTVRDGKNKGKEYDVVRYDQYGKAIYFWDRDEEKFYDENFMQLHQVINFGYQKDPKTGYIVIQCDPTGAFLYYYDQDNDKYYLDTSDSDEVTLMPVEAFPPID